jgi:glucuronate isomerase
MRNPDFLLESKTARSLYEHCKNLPVIDYHCHLSPKEIYEDKEFDNIGEMWLKDDHYKLRLMRICGIPEEKITGGAPWQEKFRAYASALQYAAGNPLYHWSHMELSEYFGIDKTLSENTAEEIWNEANRYIAEKHLSPVKLLVRSGVEIVCTTDEPTDPLEWHRKLQKKGLPFRVLPTFRTDKILLMKAEGYPAYIKKLSEVSGVEISDLDTLKQAIERRLLFFIENNCRFTDLGIQYFPDRIYEDGKADRIFKTLLSGGFISDEDYFGVLGNLIVFLGGLYKKYNLVMQWHFAVARNVNTKLYLELGADSGLDCVADPVKGRDLIGILDAINTKSGMPDMILYSLNSSNAAQIASIAGTFPNTRLGAAWWFCDHKSGIVEQLQVVSEYGSLGSFPGMVTDSRSFLSYVRHDYFRRILCSYVGSLAEKNEYDKNLAYRLVEKICYHNIEQLI